MAAASTITSGPEYETTTATNPARTADSERSPITPRRAAGWPEFVGAGVPVPPVVPVLALLVVLVLVLPVVLVLELVLSVVLVLLVSELTGRPSRRVPVPAPDRR
ncbi:hypothetical protein HEK616_75390 (plasmid) [Streptomyces nigrescens]|uniref:Uncharacterized protein n=1 Tax=Streptomyces nigrescens TaxID=1920 RepID=A0ABN6R8J5_STRNI|nr:hypothetical protein HEK616_75390 [Streptomyces nigrescens]